MTWTLGPTGLQTLRGRRVIEISDGVKTYFTPLAKGQRASSAVREFVCEYDWNGLDRERADEYGITRAVAAAELCVELRESLYSRVHRNFQVTCKA